MNERQIGDVKDIIWFLKGLVHGGDSTFSQENIDSLVDMVIQAQDRLGANK